MTIQYIQWLKNTSLNDIDIVGGKNASLGEMMQSLTQLGIKIPNGFATTAEAYRDFLQHNQIREKIQQRLEHVHYDDIQQLTAAGKEIRAWVMESELPAPFEDAIRKAWTELSNDHSEYAAAVRSSATAEDLANASFAGQQETFLNVRGIEDVLHRIKSVFASLYNDRAIAYRVHHGFEHDTVAISVGVQQMVRSDLAASGVMFTLDTESGFDGAVFITAAYGLGESVVQGSVNPDEFYVHKKKLAEDRPAIIRKSLGSKREKMIYADEHSSDLVTIQPVSEKEQQQFCINNDDIMTLARYAMLIEQHYQKPMDIEWAKDGLNGELYIVQARPETVKSQSKSNNVRTRYRMLETGHVLVEGRSIGQMIGQGSVCIMNDLSDMNHMKAGDILVTDMTDPDWEPIMAKASAIVTNRGGRTCHAAIIARELGVPAVVGCGNATKVLHDKQEITVSCAEGETGLVYDGLLRFEKIDEQDETASKELPVNIMMNIGNPDRAFAFQSIPNNGVGLARLEFIISQTIGIHPRAILDVETLTDEALKKDVLHRTQAYESPREFYIEKLKEGMATIAAAFYPETIIFRLSDFKSNEYANLLGGKHFEPHEENPMIGFRGASRYIAKNFHDCFAMECEAVHRLRETLGFENAHIMIPFVRTLSEAKQVHESLKQNKIPRGLNGLKVMMMCEVPSNVILAEEFLEYFDGFSIGSNDLTQLTLGMDRDSGLLIDAFDERDLAVKKMIQQAIKVCKQQNKYIGICGQAPSDHPDFAEWLVNQGIDSISLNPDTVLETRRRLLSMLEKEKLSS